MASSSLVDSSDARQAQFARTIESAEDATALRHHVKEIIEGKIFRGSHRSGQFLEYIVEQAISGSFDRLKERLIGVELFGRPPSYNTGDDAIVRVTANDVRKRLERHYESYGTASEFRISLPSGSYIPEAARNPNGEESRQQEPPEQDELAGLPVQSESSSNERPRLNPNFLWIGLSLSLAVACAALIWQVHLLQAALSPSKSQPAVAAFWNGFLDPHRQTTIVFADSSLSLIEDLTHRPVTLEDYTSRAFMQQIQTSDMVPDRKADLHEIFNHNLISFGEARVLQLLLKEIPPNYPRDLARARNFSGDEMMRNNVILLGGKKAQPWVHLFDDEVNFVANYDDPRSHPYVQNRNPRPGEQTAYPAPGTVESFAGYATIAYLPNPSRTGRALILAGTDSDSTAAAAAFLTSEDQMEKFRNTLHVDRFPYFEVLLKVSRMSGTFFDSECIAYRAYPELH
jgi:hypothetical protein